MVHKLSGLPKTRFRIPRTRCEPYGAHSIWVGETCVLDSQNDMRTLWCTLILGSRSLRYALPERDANPMVHTQFGLAKPWFCILRTRCEAYGAHSVWVGETWVLHSQNEMRTLWCTLILGSRNLSFGHPERDANPTVHTHSGLAKPWFCNLRTRCGPYGAHSFWVCETSVSQSQKEMRTLWCTPTLGC
jgi:hypothetical protein